MNVESHLTTLQAAANYHAGRIARKLRLSPDDHDDIRQDLLVEIIGRLRRYDAEKAAISTFIDLLARHGAYAIVKRHRNQGRVLANAISIDSGTDSEARALSEILSPDHGLGSAVIEPVDAVADADLARDARRVFAALAPELQTICLLLQLHPAEAAHRHSGLSRATFYRRLREIRLLFLVHGVDAAP